MTLGEFFGLLSENPSIILFYFISVPLTAGLAWVFGRDEGTQPPWNYLYCTLVYLACVPGIFAIILSIYLFLFERQSVTDTNLFTQVIPIISMVATLTLIKRNVDFDDIPGFSKMQGLFLILTVLLSAMWVLDRTRIIAITVIPFHYFLIGFVILLIVLRFGWKKLV